MSYCVFNQPVDVDSGRTTRSKRKTEVFEDVPFVKYALEVLSTEWAGQKEREIVEGKLVHRTTSVFWTKLCAGSCWQISL